MLYFYTFKYIFLETLISFCLCLRTDCAQHPHDACARTRHYIHTLRSPPVAVDQPRQPRHWTGRYREDDAKGAGDLLRRG